MEKNSTIEKKEINLYIPEDLEELHITGGAIASTPYNIRLILYNDEIDRTGDYLETDKMNLIRTAKAEIVMHPAVAKNILTLLEEEIKKYEEQILENK